MSKGVRYVYIIDTCSIAHLHRNFPPDIFTRIYERIDLIIKEGRLIAPNEVKREIEAGDDDISKWLSDRQEMIRPTTIEIIHEVEGIIFRSPPIADEKKEKPVADPFLIAQVIFSKTLKCHASNGFSCRLYRTASPRYLVDSIRTTPGTWADTVAVLA